MKDLLLQLRRDVLGIHTERALGLIGEQQARAKLQTLAGDFKKRKAALWAERGKQIAEIKAGIETKSRALRDVRQPKTDADYVRRTYQDAAERRRLKLLQDADLVKVLDEIREKTDDYALSPDYVEMVQVEALERGTGKIPGHPNTIDYQSMVRGLQGVLQIKHFAEPWLNTPEWKAITEQEILHANAAAPGRLQILHEGNAITFDIDDEVNYEPTRAEIDGKAQRKWTQRDNMAGLTPEPERPLVFVMGDSDDAVKHGLQTELEKYRGRDTF
jgi:hypothetical protein